MYDRGINRKAQQNQTQERPNWRADSVTGRDTRLVKTEYDGHSEMNIQTHRRGINYGN